MPPKLAAWQLLAPKGERKVGHVGEMPWLVQGGEELANHVRVTMVELSP